MPSAHDLIIPGDPVQSLKNLVNAGDLREPIAQAICAVLVPVLQSGDTGGGGGAGIPEAPQDGNLYGRENAAWAVIPPPAISNLRIAIQSDFTVPANGAGGALDVAIKDASLMFPSPGVCWYLTNLSGKGVFFIVTSVDVNGVQMQCWANGNWDAFGDPPATDIGSYNTIYPVLPPTIMPAPPAAGFSRVIATVTSTTTILSTNAPPGGDNMALVVDDNTKISSGDFLIVPGFDAGYPDGTPATGPLILMVQFVATGNTTGLTVQVQGMGKAVAGTTQIVAGTGLWFAGNKGV
jgi:hypothetical protein